MAQFVIPSIFTAQDRFSGPVRQMANNAAAFGNSISGAINNAEKGFNKMLPSLNNAQKQFFSFASAATATAGVLSAIKFSFDSLKDYESNLAELRAITGKTGAEFEGYKKNIEAVAISQKKSAVEVAKAFTVIGNAQPELLKSSEGLGLVTDATLKLAKASRMDLEPTANALTTIMNQFGLGAKDAASSIDILAAGSVAGSSEINDTAEALQKFGTVAANMGVKLNESVALVELGSRFEKGAEAGQKFRNMLITMSAIKVQDPKALKDLARLGVNLDIVQNKALPLRDRLTELSKISKDSAAIFHVFGKENQAMATGILNSTDKFQEMMDGVNRTGEAQRMMGENTSTLSSKIEQMKASFVNFMVTGDQTNGVLNAMKTMLSFVAEHMGAIITIAAILVGSLLAIKIGFIVAKVAMIGYNVVTGIMVALTGASAMSLRGNAIALGAYRVAMVLATAATWLWNAAGTALNVILSLNPIMLVVLAILALIAVVVVIIAKFDEWGAAFSLILGPLGLVIGLVMAFKRNWDLITEAFSKEGILGGLKAIGATLIDVILYPLQQILEVIADFTGFDWANDAVSSLKGFRASIGVEMGGGSGAAVASPASATNVPTMTPFDPGFAKQESFTESLITSNENKKVTLDVNLPQGATGKVSENNSLVPIKIGSTVGFSGGGGSTW